jgi:hypothetical protein
MHRVRRCLNKRDIDLLKEPKNHAIEEVGQAYLETEGLYRDPLCSPSLDVTVHSFLFVIEKQFILKQETEKSTTVRIKCA